LCQLAAAVCIKNAAICRAIENYTNGISHMNGDILLNIVARVGVNSGLSGDGRIIRSIGKVVNNSPPSVGSFLEN
jgi:hypothetical protein